MYGSLQPGGSNEHVLAGVDGHWERASVRGRLVDSGWGSALGFPGLIPDDDGDIVDGWLFTSAALLPRWADLDAFEGAEYERRIVPVALPSGETVTAQVYALRDAGTAPP